MALTSEQVEAIKKEVKSVIDNYGAKGSVVKSIQEMHIRGLERAKNALRQAESRIEWHDEYRRQYLREIAKHEAT